MGKRWKLYEGEEWMSEDRRMVRSEMRKGDAGKED